MPTLFGLPECDMVADLVLGRQTSGRDKGVILGIEHQCWHLHTCEPGFCARPVPIIICAIEAVQRRCEHVIKRVQGVGYSQLLRIKQAWELG